MPSCTILYTLYNKVSILLTLDLHGPCVYIIQRANKPTKNYINFMPLRMLLFGCSHNKLKT